jgi:hypothetical protein
MANILKLLPKLIVSILIAIFWIDDFVAIAITVFGFVLSIPTIIASIYFTIASRKFSDRWQKALFIWGIFNLLFFCAYLIFRHPAQGCNANMMAKYYENNSEKIEELLKYIDEAQDDSTLLVLEFTPEKVSTFHISTNKGDYFEYKYSAEQKKDSLMQEVGLTHNEYENIRSLLSNLNCIGIESDKRMPNNEVTIRFKRVGFGMYSFVLHNSPINQQQKDIYMNDMAYVPYNDSVIFMYGSGVLGSDTFHHKERFLRKHKPW